MITGIRIDKVEAKRDKNEDVKGLDVNIGIDNVKVTGPEVEIEFNYTASYQDGVGTLKMNGALLAHEDDKGAKEISESWKKSKKLPDSFSEMVLNAINFTCGTNGVLVVRPVNLAPPMIPPRIQLRKPEKEA
ncbi:MAG: hypothetical protein V1822_02680 [Candidatus Micrarchaeota archaeon]